MKITTLGLAMLFVGLAAGPVYAADGHAKFHRQGRERRLQTRRGGQ